MCVNMCLCIRIICTLTNKALAIRENCLTCSWSLTEYVFFTLGGPLVRITFLMASLKRKNTFWIIYTVLRGFFLYAYNVLNVSGRFFTTTTYIHRHRKKKKKEEIFEKITTETYWKKKIEHWESPKNIDYNFKVAIRQYALIIFYRTTWNIHKIIKDTHPIDKVA